MQPLHKRKFAFDKYQEHINLPKQRKHVVGMLTFTSRKLSIRGIVIISFLNIPYKAKTPIKQALTLLSQFG